jgi:hypothetical protein
MVLSNIQVDEIAEKIRSFNLTPFPQGLDAEILNIMMEYKKEYGDEVENYPKDIRALMAYLQDLPGQYVYFNQMIDILNDVNLRRWIQPLVLGNIDTGLIYVLVSTKTDKLYDEGAFADFINYFFNLKDFSVKDKYDLYTRETDPRTKGFYELALNYEKDKLIWKLGFTPDVSVETIVRTVATESMMKFKESFDEDKAAKLGTLALKAADKLQELDGEKKKDLETAAGFEISLLRQKPSVKLLKDLEGEN